MCELVGNNQQTPTAGIQQLQPTSLQDLIEKASPQLLEKGVQTGLQILATIEQLLDGYKGDLQSCDQFKTQIELIKKQQAQQHRVVVGVVGNTGAGKSSVINALLEEERLLLTNCMRACTAVVTEVSWNGEKNERKKYRAEIEYIKAEDWQKELETLLEDLISENGEATRDAYRNTDTQAAIAYAKNKAVYPDITRETISHTDPDTLLNDFRVKNLLGKTHEIFDSSPSFFYEKLQKYVDNKERPTEKNKEKKEMEYWPLIKVVRIYVKSDALATGAVIVDLPSVHDSNAARAAVAEGYLRQCTWLWIVTPIIRAVDDKAARKFLGDQFKRQLKHDGIYNNVTFICSKTDDINITEASKAVNATRQIHKRFNRIDKLESKVAKTEARKQKLALTRKRVNKIKERIQERQSNIAAQWVLGRNQYSKGAIQRDFATALKELDEENATEEDENFNPDEDLRDYDAVAQSLSVYCVSSKAYQKMCGRMKMDAMPSGFRTKEETEIPWLKDHCKQLTKTSRISNYRRFLSNLDQLLNSLIIRPLNDSSGVKLTDAQHQTLQSSLALLKRVINGGEKDDEVVQMCWRAHAPSSGLLSGASATAFERYESDMAASSSQGGDSLTRKHSRCSLMRCCQHV